MSLATDVLDYLVAQGLIAGTTGWAQGLAFLPESPDKVVVVYPTGGLPPELDASGATQYDEPGFQVRIRGDKPAVTNHYTTMEAKINAIFQALHGSQLGDADTYIQVLAEQSEMFPLGRDENGRPGATWNFTAMRARGA